MKVCGQCGVGRAPRQRACDGCGSSRPALERAAPSDLRCVALRLEFRCPACDRWAPIDGPPASWNGASAPQVCARCGVTSPLTEAHWRAVLQAAHAVADLFGPDAEGVQPSRVAVDLVNPFASEGATRGAVQLAPLAVEGLTGFLPSDLKAWVAPGLPLSGEDKQPPTFRGDREVLETRSGSDVRRYAVDPHGVRLHPALVGAISEEVERDRPEAAVVAAVGRTVCGSCRADFVLDGTELRARCGVCGEINRVPAAIRHAAQGEPRPDTWWLLFRGPSPLRARLEGSGPPWRADAELGWEAAPLRPPAPPERLGLLAWRVGGPLLALGAVGVLAALSALFG